MGYHLAIGDRTYSSWSLRGWLLFEKFGIPVTVETGILYSESLYTLLERYAPARQVPAMRTPEGEVVGESIAIAETLAERHAEAGHWPEDRDARAMARYMAAEMHAGFRDLRNDCPMNLAKSYSGFTARAEVRRDLDRIALIWRRARERFGSSGPWLFGRYTAADAFFAPVAARIATYGLEMPADAMAYAHAHLADPAFRRWRAMGLAADAEQPSYRMDFPLRPWPGPAPVPAEPANAAAENSACPYSGRPVTHMLRIEGRVWGFCNAFCRDKTMRDPEAWPAFMALVRAA